MTAMRLGRSPSQLAIGLWQMIWAPRYLMIPLQVSVEAYDFNQVSIFIRYLWMFF